MSDIFGGFACGAAFVIASVLVMAIGFGIAETKYTKECAVCVGPCPTWDEAK